MACPGEILDAIPTPTPGFLCNADYSEVTLVEKIDFQFVKIVN